jgi:hypothetical protein
MESFKKGRLQHKRAPGKTSSRAGDRGRCPVASALPTLPQSRMVSGLCGLTAGVGVSRTFRADSQLEARISGGIGGKSGLFVRSARKRRAGVSEPGSVSPAQRLSREPRWGLWVPPLRPPPRLNGGRGEARLSPPEKRLSSEPRPIEAQRVPAQSGLYLQSATVTRAVSADC